MVFWHTPAEERFNFLKLMRDFEEESYDSRLVQDESESMEYLHNSGSVAAVKLFSYICEGVTVSSEPFVFSLEFILTR